MSVTVPADLARPQPPAEPPEELIFRRGLSPLHTLRELWEHRELVRTLTERGLRSRYKQTFLGFSWAIITPVTLMVVFTLFFQRVAKIHPPGDVWYPVFSYVGLLPWTFFSGSVGSAGSVIISNTSLLNKVYCPREVFPLSQVATSVVDTMCAVLALLVLIGLAPILGHHALEPPSLNWLWFPAVAAVLVVFTVGVSFAFAALTVFLRDLRYGLPIILQLGLFATPIAYEFQEIPGAWRPLYSMLNPLGPVIDSLRNIFLLGRAPNTRLLLIAGVASCVYVAIGYVVFKKLEPGFSDVA